ncbi:MAG: MFS transporter [Anaerolineae bacterium]|jgi:MFS transporter, NNP family, nitrate/nitrite transporter|nr:MFS transporter [Anaerolineae bacterium]MBT7074714.1 MFS transporter [Anaerolineae bacterium]MBT7781859.1 MFS transporter [Anaerolineae bacterium]
MPEKRTAYRVLALNTIAFTVCFAAWMLNGVLVTFLVDNRIFDWNAAQMGMLIGIPVLTGALMRLPLGVLTDKFGGRPVYTLLMLFSAIPMFMLGQANSYNEYLIYSLGFGMTGTSFAVGIAFSSVWFSKEKQGTALGIFGAGNAGAALTTMGAPSLLRWLTDNGENLEGWRKLPAYYAVALVVMAIVFYFFTTNRKPENGQRSIIQMLAPLKQMRVWRFGMYYFLVFGGFVALAQWLVPYYVNVYAMTIVTAGLLTSIFSLPSGVIRALGGVLSDKFGARTVMYWVFGFIAVCSFLLFFPKMSIESPGSGVMARRSGTVTSVTASKIQVDDATYSLIPKVEAEYDADEVILFPRINTWQDANVEVGDQVAKKELLASGVTHIYFQANVWVFTFFVFIIGIAMGIGKAGVYKFIPEYFPTEVGVVGGIVGVVGGLGGFVSPIIFGSLLKSIGLWTTTWIFFFFVTMLCLIWMGLSVRKNAKKKQVEA